VSTGRNQITRIKGQDKRVKSHWSKVNWTGQWSSPKSQGSNLTYQGSTLLGQVPQVKGQVQRVKGQVRRTCKNSLSPHQSSASGVNDRPGTTSYTCLLTKIRRTADLEVNLQIVGIVMSGHIFRKGAWPESRDPLICWALNANCSMEQQRHTRGPAGRLRQHPAPLTS